MFKGLGVHFADFISIFLNIPWKQNNLVSVRPNYFIFIGYLKTGGGEGGSSDPPETPLDPPLPKQSVTERSRKIIWALLAHRCLLDFQPDKIQISQSAKLQRLAILNLKLGCNNLVKLLYKQQDQNGQCAALSVPLMFALIKMGFSSFLPWHKLITQICFLDFLNQSFKKESLSK